MNNKHPYQRNRRLFLNPRPAPPRAPTAAVIKRNITLISNIDKLENLPPAAAPSSYFKKQLLLRKVKNMKFAEMKKV